MNLERSVDNLFQSKRLSLDVGSSANLIGWATNASCALRTAMRVLKILDAAAWSRQFLP